MLLQIGAAFRLIPLERNHTYSVCTCADLSISGPNAQVSGAQHGALARGTMAKPYPSKCGVLSVRARVANGLTALLDALPCAL